MYHQASRISESPVSAGVMYVGTDDGIVQGTQDGGQTWTRASSMTGVPELSFIQDVEASQHDAATVFAVADAHKIGDFSPYLFKSSDYGRTWRSIAGDLPDGMILWAIEQDHVNPNLLFLGAERGLFFLNQWWDQLA